VIQASSSPDNSFFDEFLDDFFAECDEHLTVIRRDLLALETFVDAPQVERALLEELFRSFHSLKGLSGMVGAGVVERLAHQIENYFRALRDQQIVLRADALDTLIASVRVLEQSLAAWRARQPSPSIEPTLAALSGLLAPQPAAPSDESAAAGAPSAPNGAHPSPPSVAAERRMWRFEFLPTPALAAREINVNTVRARLQELGEIVKATPQVRPEGGVAFEFVVLTAADEQGFAAWDQDGLRWSRVDPPPAPRPAEPAASVASSNVVRVDLAHLDDLMEMIGALVITRARLEDRLERLEPQIEVGEWRDLHDLHLLLGRQLRDLREGVVRARMAPMGDLFARMQFVVRDLARELGKQVRLDLQGQHTEVDKYIIERLADPLLHLVRNAISHGVELPAERAAQGKPAEGRLTLTAAAAGDLVTIALADDGRGIDRRRVAERARTLGLYDGGELLDDAQLLHVLCLPGFSTREQADRVSGRGVGMDVVQQTIHELGGALTLETELGRGARFTIQAPLTLTIVDALIIEAGDQTFAAPVPAVREAIALDPQCITALENNELLRYRDRVLPLVRLARVFGLRADPQRAGYALILGHEPHMIALAVDRLLTKREIVVRTLSDPLVQTVGVSGATELGDGRVVLILDAGGLMQLVRQGAARRPAAGVSADDGRTSSMRHETPTTEPYILMELAGATYGVRSSSVLHIDMIEHVTPAPNAPPALDGIALVRGRLVPALNLRTRFGFPKQPYDLRTRLVVIRHDQREVGLIVDAAREFVQIPADALQPPPEVIAGLSGNYLDMIATLGERLVLLLNLHEVLRLGEPLPSDAETV
jgi:two-component system chemotaxis sensor kinase CheA